MEIKTTVFKSHTKAKSWVARQMFEQMNIVFQKDLGLFHDMVKFYDSEEPRLLEYNKVGLVQIKSKYQNDLEQMLEIDSNLGPVMKRDDQVWQCTYSVKEVKL